MKRSLLKFSTLIILFLATKASVFSQTTFTSIASGDWHNPAIWSKVGSATNDFPIRGDDVVISAGNVVGVSNATEVGNLEVKSGGELTTSVSASAAVAFTIRGGTTSATLPLQNVITNNGSIKSDYTGKKELVIYVANNVKSFSFNGDGETSIGRFLLNDRSSATPFEAIINTSLNLYSTGFSFGAANYKDTGRTLNNNVTLTLNSGNTVTAAGHFHNDANTLGILGGKYVYKINGNLVLNGSVINFSPSSNAGAQLIMDVLGTVTVKSLLKTAKTNLTDEGIVKINVKGNGKIDFQGINYLDMPNAFFNISDNGVIEKNVSKNNRDGFSAPTYIPIGTGDKIFPVEITNNSTTDTKYILKLNNDFNYSALDNRNLVNVRWEINSNVSRLSTIKFKWLPVAVGSILADNLSSNLSLYRRGTAATDWAETSLGTPVLADGLYTVELNTEVSVSGDYFLLGLPGVLPLNLVSVNIDKVTGKLTWITENEKKVAHFEIEKSSNGKDFVKIGTLNAKNSNGRNYYSYVDQSLVDKTVYYRLKMVDLNDQFSYSRVLSYNASLFVNVSVYPNPVTELVKLKLPFDVDANQINVLNTEGKRLEVRAYKISNGYFEIDFSNQANGAYFVSIDSSAANVIKKIVKR